MSADTTRRRPAGRHVWITGRTNTAHPGIDVTTVRWAWTFRTALRHWRVLVGGRRAGMEEPSPGSIMFFDTREEYEVFFFRGEVR